MTTTNQTDNAFQRFWEAGYTRLCPIIPPGAPLDPESAAAKRLASHPDKDPRGKAPGVPGVDGLWKGLDFVHTESTEFSVAKWHEDGAGVGIKTGDGLIAVDIDTTDPSKAAQLTKAAIQILGEAPARIGRAPKTLLLYRVAESIPYEKVTFSTETEDRALVEILSEGRQFVAHGVHPTTSRPYHWPEGVPQYDELPTTDAEALEAYLAWVEQNSDAPRRFSGGSIDRSEIDQSTLVGDRDLITQALARLPNTTATFPTRDDYLRVGYAVKAAFGPELEQEAFSAFFDWCSRWDGGVNDHNEVLSDWNRMKPPYMVGSSWLYKQAEDLGGWRGRVESIFNDLGERPAAETDPFDWIRPEIDEGPAAEPIKPHRLSLGDLAEIPPRQWLYGSKISRGYTTILSSPGGVGKTALATVLAVSCAAGSELIGDTPVHPLKVWMYNLEDDLTEIKRRLKAALLFYGLGDDVLANILVLSGRDRRLSLLKQDNKGSLTELPDADLLKASIIDNGVDLLVVDPFARSHQVNENDTSAQDELMRIYAQVAHEASCGVLLLHHFNKQGEAGDMNAVRGSSALTAGARSVLTVAPMPEDDAKALGIEVSQRRRYIRIDDAKNNMSPPARSAEWLFLDSFDLENGTEIYPQGDSVQVATAWTPPGPGDGMTRSDEEAALAVLDEGLAGERFSAKPSAKTRWAGDMLMERFGRSRVQAVGLLNKWLKLNYIEERSYRSPTYRRSTQGIFVNFSSFASEVFEDLGDGGSVLN